MVKIFSDLNDDPIYDLLDRAVREYARTGVFDDQSARRVERAFRYDWYGEKVTIGRLGAVEKMERHAAITRATERARAERVGITRIADDEGVCRRTLYRWLKR